MCVSGQSLCLIRHEGKSIDAFYQSLYVRINVHVVCQGLLILFCILAEENPIKGQVHVVTTMQAEINGLTVILRRKILQEGDT